jgi:predicted phosphoribosyltransferase
MRNLLFILDAPAAPPTAVEIVETLEHAREFLASGTALAKGNAVDWINRCYCIVAAVTVASRTTQIRDAALQAIRLALPGRFHGQPIEAYNDHPETTLDDAKTLLWRAKSYAGTMAAA